MDNEKHLQPEQDDGWFDKLLDAPQEPPQQELGLDESAIFAAGLIHPADMELEKIITEAKAMDDVTADTPMAASSPAEAVSSADVPYGADSYQQPFDESPIVFDNPAPSRPQYAVPAADTQPLPTAEIFQTESEYPQPATGREPRKRRPKMKKGYGLLGIPHILSTVVWALVVLAVGFSLGRLAWVCASDVLAFGKNPMEAVINIQLDDDTSDVANKLKDAGLIRYPQLFALYMDFSGNDALAVGEHRLSAMIYDYHAIKTALSPKTSARQTVEVVIPEGYTCAQIFSLLEEKSVCTAAELEEYAANGDLNEYWFLQGVQRGDKYCLEGYLFPDTYQFYKGHDPELVLEKMLDNFDYRFTDIMMEKMESLNDRLEATLRSRGYGDSYIEAHRFTIREVVIVASMIERETANGAESYDISSVIYNRLTNPANYPYLNIDATVIYGMGGSKIDPVTGEALPLTQADTQVDTPYNTYTRKGLIPGPISNPGRNSLDAALDPNETDYYYYVYNPSAGGHKFARNAREHEQNKASIGN